MELRWLSKGRTNGRESVHQWNPKTRKPPLTSGGAVARAGIEPATFHFSGERYYQLSYLAVWPDCRPSDPDGTRTRDLRRDRAAR